MKTSLGYSTIEQLMVHGEVTNVEISKGDSVRGESVHEVTTFCEGRPVIRNCIANINGILHDCNDAYLIFDCEPEDAVLTPVVCLPRKETAEAVASFFGVDTSHIPLGVDESLLFRLKYEAGYVWDFEVDDFVPRQSASSEAIAVAEARHAEGWVGLYDPSESSAVALNDLSLFHINSGQSSAWF